MGDTYIYQRRIGSEKHYLGEWITPNAYMVQSLLPRFGSDPDSFALAAWKYITSHKTYPPSDAHEVFMFNNSFGIPKRHYVSDDFFYFPSETLAMGYGDCKDTSTALVSILRNQFQPNEVYVTFGTWQGWDHAWPVIQKNGQNYILESTLDNVPWNNAYQVSEGSDPDYQPYIRFNDINTITLKDPTALELVPVNEKVKITGLKKKWTL